MNERPADELAVLLYGRRAGMDRSRRVDGRVVRPVMAELERIGPPPAAVAPGPTDQTRQPRGVPTGGQWATHPRAEAEVFLDDGTWANDA